VGRVDGWLAQQRTRVVGRTCARRRRCGGLGLVPPELLPGLLDGYRADAEERAIFAELVPFYTVLRRVSYAEWMRQHGTEAELTDALDRLAATGIP